MKTLIGTVTNILHKKVTEQEAKDYAFNHFGELCTHIRQEFTKKIIEGRVVESDVYIGAGKKKLKNKIY